MPAWSPTICATATSTGASGCVVNGFAAVVCAVVVVVFAVAEFTQGAWVVVVVMPLLVYALVTMNREYRAEDAVLEEGAAVEACEAKVLRRHVVMVLVDRIDLATARAIQYARSAHARRSARRALQHRPRPARTCSSSAGSASASPGSRSTWSTARTGGSAGPPSSWPPSRPTARPR